MRASIHGVLLALVLTLALAAGLVGCDDDGDGASPEPLPMEPAAPGQALTVSVTHGESVLATGSCALDLLALPDGGSVPYSYRWDSVFLQGPWTEQSLRLSFAPGTSQEVLVRLTVGDAEGAVNKLTVRYAVTCPVVGSSSAARAVRIGGDP